MKKLFALILISTLLISSSIAEEIFSDDFTTSDNISSSTNLKHVNGYLTVESEYYYPNAIAVSDKTTEYAVIDNGKIKIYTLNEDNSTTISEIEDKYNIISSPIGITYANDGHSIWILNEDSLVKYDLNGNNNVVNKISGANELIGITSSKGYETVSILDSGGKVTGYKELIEGGKVTGYKELIEGGIEEVPALSTSEIDNPLAISSVGGTDNIIVMNNEQIAIFEYDENNSKLQESIKVTIGNSPVAISANKNGFVLANKTGVYTFEGFKEGDRKVIYKDESINNAVGVSLKQDEYEYAIIDEDGNVKYYEYDGSEMKENENLAAQNIELPKKPKSQATYTSVLLPEEGEAIYDKITLQVEQKNTTDFDIEWRVHTDVASYSFGRNGGTIELDEGSSTFTIYAEIEYKGNSVKYDMLEIHSVKLIMDNKEEEAAIEEVKIIGITKNMEEEQELPIEERNFPAIVKRGSQVVVQVKTVGNIEDINMILSTEDGILDEVELMPIEGEIGVFIGTTIFEPDELEGEIIQVVFLPNEGPPKICPTFLKIRSAVSYDLDLQIRQ